MAWTFNKMGVSVDFDGSVVLDERCNPCGLPFRKGGPSQPSTLKRLLRSPFSGSPGFLVRSEGRARGPTGRPRFRLCG